MDELLKKPLLRTFAFVLVISLGPLLFVHVEYTEKDDKEEKYQLLRSLYESVVSKYNMTIEDFNNFSNIASEALSVPKPRWTYLASVDFVMQATTTIGYGYITPQTEAGQLLCIFISLIGIPITLLALKSVGELIAKLVNATVTKFEKKILKTAEPKHVQTKSAVLLFLLMTLIMIAAGFLSVKISNDWSFVNGMYFWFITFSTIGFGDYIVHHPTKRIKKLHANVSEYQETRDLEGLASHPPTVSSFLFILTMCFYLILLCIVSSVVNSIMFALEETGRHPPCRGCFTQKTEDDVNSEQSNTQRQNQNSILSMTSFAPSTSNFGFQEG